MGQVISLRSLIMRPAFNPSTVRTEFMINEVILREVSLRLFHNFPCQYNSTDRLSPSSSLSLMLWLQRGSRKLFETTVTLT
jgi:hypothetical protein